MATYVKCQQTLGIGAAIHTGNKNFTASDQKTLGSRVLFHVPLELGYYANPRTMVSAYLDHISNGNTANENEGLDSIGARSGYIF